jgi:hypothetical protein
LACISQPKEDFTKEFRRVIISTSICVTRVARKLEENIEWHTGGGSATGQGKNCVD